MTIRKTALAGALLTLLSVSAQAQQGPTRQIQVLPAPTQVAQGPTVTTDARGPSDDAGAPEADAQASETAPEPDPIAAPKRAPQVASKFLAAGPREARPEPKFVEPRFAPPVRKVSYGSGGYGRRNCH